MNFRLHIHNQWSSRNFAHCSLVLAFLALFFVSGCTTTYAPVEHRNSTSYKASNSVKKRYVGKTPTFYKVKRGDTLYSIAWKYGQDYKNLAYRNKIKAPYRIYVGKTLRLLPDSSKKNIKKPKVSYTKGRKEYSRGQVQSSGVAASKTKAATGNSNKKSLGKKRTVARTPNNKKLKTFSGSKQLRWSWPVKGKIIQRYSPGSGKKGIDISAGKGSLIKSAEAGKVVYSGQGLVGYGRLIIIKHNDTFLSAYAHNQSLLVNEGQIVKKGQNIARLGRSGTDRYKLHFEIRKNGKPVNPMSYLPH